MRGGWWQIAAWHGAPIRLHWSVPLGALAFSSGRFEPGFWLAYVLLIFLHEMSHAALAHRYQLRVLEIAVHGVGGHCAHEAASTHWQSAVIASGGVLAQMAALAAAVIWVALAGPPTTPFARDMYGAFTHTNIALAAINLIPIHPLDGAKIWQLPRLFRARLKDRSRERARLHASRRRRQTQSEISKLKRAEADGILEPKSREVIDELVRRTTQK